MGLLSRRPKAEAAVDDPGPVVGQAPGSNDLGTRWGPSLTWAALAVTLLPLIVSAVTAVQDLDGGYYAAGDLASIELKTGDVLRHPVLTGLFSRDGWDHPGPAMFYVLAVPYRLLGSHSWGLHVGALLVNGASIVGMALIARRRGGTPLFLLTLMSAALVVQSLGADFIRDPWNPFLPVLPFGLLLFLVWEMTCGTPWALPAAAALASFCVQTHIGYGPLAFPLLVWGAVWLVVAWRRTGAPRGRTLVQAAVIAAVVLLVLWLPPVVEELFDGQGNLGTIAEYFLDDEDQEHHTVTEGYRLVSGQFGWPPPWLTGRLDDNRFTGQPIILDRSTTPLLLLPLVAASVVLWRLRVANSRRLLALIALVLTLGVVWVARTLGPVFGYRVAWVSVVGMVAFLPMGWALWSFVARRLGGSATRVLVALSVAALVVLGLRNIASATDQPVPAFAEPWSAELAATVSTVVRALPDGEGDVILRCDGDAGCIYITGLFLELQERGLRPRTERAYGVVSSNAPHRAHREGPVRAVVHVTLNERYDRMALRDDVRLIAYRSPQSPRERAIVVDRIRRVDELHERGQLSDVDYFLERVGLARRLGRALGVFIEPL